MSTDSKKLPLDELMEETIGGFGRYSYFEREKPKKGFRYHIILVFLVTSPIIATAAHVLSWTFVASEQVFPGNSSIFSQVKYFIKARTSF